jgi:hypothetical protein
MAEQLKPSARRALRWYSSTTKEQRQDFHRRWGAWHTDEAKGYAKAIIDAFVKLHVPNGN